LTDLPHSLEHHIWFSLYLTGMLPAYLLSTFKILW